MTSFDDDPKKPIPLRLSFIVLAKNRRADFDRWVAENPDAIRSYNERVLRNGMWNSALRKRRGSI